MFSYRRILALVLGGVLLFAGATVARAYDEELDQRQLEGGSCVTAYSGYNHNQTYQPSLNVLTKVEVKMKHRSGGSNIVLTIKDEVTGQVVVTVNQRMGDGDGWETFDLTGDELGQILDTDHLHSIWIGTEYFGGTEAPCWEYTLMDYYEFGVRRQGSVDKTGDLTFATYGYDIDMDRGNPEPLPEEPEGEPPAENPPADDGEQGDSSADNTQSEPGATEPPDIPVVASEAVVEESETVTPPELENVVVNDSLVEVDGTLDVDSGDIVKITGTADPGNTVVVVIGDDAYTAKANDDGNWYVIIDTGEIDDGVYEILAQAKTDDDLGSEMVVLFSMTVGESVVATPAGSVVVDGEDETDSLWYKLTKGDWRYGTIVFLVALGVGIFLLFAWYKKKKEKPAQKTIDEVTGTE